MNDLWWIWGVRAAGVFHFVTLGMALITPIPPNWEENLARLPEIHRRFAVAQNFFIGATMAFFGVISLLFAPELAAGSTASRIVCTGIALWWGGRLFVLPWLRVWPQLAGAGWRLGFMVLHVECAVYALAYGWLAVRSL
ncbi:MAG: hypothetical protein ABIZ81_02240 [Opitutaceae bacterium]